MNLRKEIVQLYILFAVSVFTVYYANILAGAALLIGYLIFFYRSERNYFWFAFIFIVEANPGGFFLMQDPENTFSILKNTPFGILYFWIVFLMVAIYKSFLVRGNFPFFIRRNLLIMFVYFIGLILVFGVFKLSSFVRSLLPWLLLLPFNKLFARREDYFRFFILVSSFVPLVLIFQFYQIFSGIEFSQLLGGTGNLSLDDSSVLKSDEAVRAVSGIFIPYLSIIGATFLLAYGNSMIRKPYLVLVLGLSLFSIYITATRSWLISSILIVLIYFFLSMDNPLKTIKKLAVPVILIAILLIKVPFLNRQFELSSERYGSVILLAEGDKSAGGTLSRFTERGPAVMAKFKESPLVGHGYGKYSMRYSDGHVGNENMLLHMGIFGFAFYLGLWIRYIMKLYNRKVAISRINPYKKTFPLIIGFLPAFLIIHTTSQWFDFLLSFESGFTFLFVFSLASFIYYDSRIAEMDIKNNNTVNLPC